LDGALADLKKRYSSYKTLVVDYLGEKLSVIDGMSIMKDMDGHAEIAVDTGVISVSAVIAHISAQVEVNDISVTGASAEEMVVSLYREFKI
jgi:ABC-2 type transport system ATP-binding protein